MQGRRLTTRAVAPGDLAALALADVDRRSERSEFADFTPPAAQPQAHSPNWTPGCGNCCDWRLQLLLAT
jgi:hypothetical protein